MKYIDSIVDFLLKENYKETHWKDMINGKDITITIGDVEDYLKDEPIIKIPTDEIKNLSIHKTKTDKQTLDRVASSDLKYPIIISKSISGDYSMILDGHHRLQKAINTNQEFINAKVLDLKNAPKEWQIMFRS